MKTSIWPFGIGICFVIASCSENDPPQDLDVLAGPYVSLTEAYESLAPEEQIYTLNADIGGTIIGQDGTQLIFGPNVLVHNTGAFVTGNVTVRLIEILSVEDMITSGIYPVDVDGNLLNSGGEIYVNITQDGETLEIASGASYMIRIPSNGTDTPMDWYVGTGNTETGLWAITPAIFDSIGGTWDDPYYDEFTDMYEIITSTLGWMNCDALAEFGTVHMYLHVTGIDDVDEAAASFYYLPDLLMCASEVYGPWEPLTNTLELSLFDSPGYILVSTIYDGNFYYGLTHIDPEEGVTFDIPVAEATLAEFEAALDALW